MRRRLFLAVAMMLTETLQPLLAPVVLISACGLLIMALNARVMTAKGRIRQLHNERLAIHERTAEAGHATPAQTLRFEGVGVQSSHLLCRLGMIRGALMCLVVCVVMMLACSLLIGLHGLHDMFSHLAVGAFVLGILSMLIGTTIFLAELRVSLREVRYEHERLMMLTLPQKGGGAGP